MFLPRWLRFGIGFYQGGGIESMDEGKVEVYIAVFGVALGVAALGYVEITPYWMKSWCPEWRGTTLNSRAGIRLLLLTVLALMPLLKSLWLMFSMIDLILFQILLPNTVALVISSFDIVAWSL